MLINFIFLGIFPQVYLTSAEEQSSSRNILTMDCATGVINVLLWGYINTLELVSGSLYGRVHHIHSESQLIFLVNSLMNLGDFIIRWMNYIDCRMSLGRMYRVPLYNMLSKDYVHIAMYEYDNR